MLDPDALVSALVGLNMTPTTARAVVTVIESITRPVPPTINASHDVRVEGDVVQGEGNYTIDDAGDHTDDYEDATESSISFSAAPSAPPISISIASTPTLASPIPITAKTSTPAPCMAASTAEAPAPIPAASTAMTPGAPRLMSYRGFTYEVPPPTHAGPFYCVTKGRRVGVLATW